MIVEKQGQPFVTLVGLDVNVLLAGIHVPCWPYEIMQAARAGLFTLVLSE